DEPALGAEDRYRPPPAAVRRQHDLPPDVPLRAALGRRRRAAPALAGEALPDPGAGALLPLRRLLLLRPLLRGAPARRPVAPLRRPAPERLGLDRLLHRRHGRVLLGAAPRQGRGAAAAAPHGARRAEDGRPAWSRPLG